MHFPTKYLLVLILLAGINAQRRLCTWCSCNPSSKVVRCSNPRIDPFRLAVPLNSAYLIWDCRGSAAREVIIEKLNKFKNLRLLDIRNQQAAFDCKSLYLIDKKITVKTDCTGLSTPGKGNELSYPTISTKVDKIMSTGKDYRTHRDFSVSHTSTERDTFNITSAINVTGSNTSVPIAAISVVTILGILFLTLFVGVCLYIQKRRKTSRNGIFMNNAIYKPFMTLSRESLDERVSAVLKRWSKSNEHNL